MLQNKRAEMFCRRKGAVRRILLCSFPAFAAALPLFCAALLPGAALAAGEEPEAPSQKTGYSQAVRNYFAGLAAEEPLLQKLALYGGASIYREIKEKSLPPFTSFIFAFEQGIKEFPKIGGLSLQISVHSMRLEGSRSTAIEFSPRFSFPSGKNGFPFYTGAGLGLGVFPRHIIKSRPALSFNMQAFAGLRFAGLYENLGLMAELSLKMQTPFSDLKIYMEILALAGLLFSF